MLSLCRSFSDRPYKLFLSGSTEDQRLFDLLVKSYHGARYTSSFCVDVDEATQLYRRVSSFLQLTKTMCSSHLERMDKEESIYQELENVVGLGLPKDLCCETN